MRSKGIPNVDWSFIQRRSRSYIYRLCKNYATEFEVHILLCEDIYIVAHIIFVAWYIRGVWDGMGCVGIYRAHTKESEGF